MLDNEKGVEPMSCRNRSRFVSELLRMCDCLETPDLEHVLTEIQKMLKVKQSIEEVDRESTQ